MPFKLTDAHTSGDIGLTATGRDLAELFVDSALGLTSIMVESGGLSERRQIPIALEAETLEKLYLHWLSEIIYLKDAESFLLRGCEIRIFQTEKAILKGVLRGDTIDRQHHILKADVKAVTYYKFRLEQVGEVWQGEVVFDL
ncbi:putative Protein archease [Candidatus Zixiibacteriota bacterium]|nr:putative Protein archease [candidate division Zixibacteria bacterium]